jgi:hypothetical protein
VGQQACPRRRCAAHVRRELHRRRRNDHRQAVGLKFIEQANVLSLALPSGAATSRSVGVVYNNSDRTSVKLSVQTTASAEAAASSDQSTFTVRVQFIGTGGSI